MGFFRKKDISLFDNINIDNIDIEKSNSFIEYSNDDVNVEEVIEYSEDNNSLSEVIEYDYFSKRRMKRRKKLLEFFGFLKNSQVQNSAYQIKKIHFLEKIKIGKEKLGKSVTIPSVYVVEYAKKWEETNNKELSKYEIYDDETKRLIMRTDNQGNLVLTKEIAKLLGSNSKRLGLEKEEKIRIRQINDMLWISSQSLMQKSMKEQQEKASISKINQTFDLQRERLRQNPILRKFEQAREELQKQGFLQDKLAEKDYKNIMNILSSDNYLTLDDAKTAIKIAQVSKDLEDNGDLASELTEKEMLKVKERLASNPDASLKEVKEAIQNEIGLERLPRKPY